VALINSRKVLLGRLRSALLGGKGTSSLQDAISEVLFEFHSVNLDLLLDENVELL